MANTTNNTSKGFENVKNVKINVIGTARELQQKADSIRKKASALMASIKLRETEFSKQSAAEVEQQPVVEVAPVVEPKKEEPQKVAVEKVAAYLRPGELIVLV